MKNLFLIDRVVAAATAAFLFLAGLSARAAVYGWTNTSGGNWSNTNNWSPNSVPGSGDDAFITASGTYGVSLDTSPTVNSLTVGGSSGTQTLHTGGYTLVLSNASAVNGNGVFDLEGGAFDGPGPLTVGGVLNWTGGQIGSSGVASTLTVATNGLLVVAFQPGGQYDFWGILTNAGTMRFSSGNVRLVGGCGFNYATLVNLAGALVDIQADSSILAYCGGTPFTSFGTVRKSGGTGTSAIGAAFYNSGTVDAQTGTLNLNGGGEGVGLFEAEAGATLQFGGGTYTLDPGGLMAGAGTNLFSAGTVVVNGSATGSNLVLAGTTLEGGGVISGALTWTSGQIGSSGTAAALTVATNGLLVVAFQPGGQYDIWGILTNAGTMRFSSGNVRLVGGCGYSYSTLVNLAGALVDIQADSSILV